MISEDEHMSNVVLLNQAAMSDGTSVSNLPSYVLHIPLTDNPLTLYLVKPQALMLVNDAVHHQHAGARRAQCIYNTACFSV